MPLKKPKLLKDLEVDEVALVDRPANQLSLSVLHKKGVGKGDPTPSDVHIPAAINPKAMSPSKCKTCGTKHAPGAACASDDDGDGDMKKSLSSRVIAFVKSFAPALGIEDGTDIEEIPELPDEAPVTLDELSAALASSIAKAMHDAPDSDTALNAVGEELAAFNAIIIEKVAASLDDDAEVPDAGASTGDRSSNKTPTEKGMDKNKTEKKPDDNITAIAGITGVATEIVTKAEHEEVKTSLAKKDEEIVSLTKRLEAMENAALDRAALDEATVLVGKSGIAPAKVAVLLRKGDAESIAAVKEIVGQAGAFAKKAKLFEEIGVEGEGSTDEQEVAKAVADMRKADPKLTQEQAIAKLYAENPELYDAEDEGYTDDPDEE